MLAACRTHDHFVALSESIWECSWYEPTPFPHEAIVCDGGERKDAIVWPALGGRRTLLVSILGSTTNRNEVYTFIFAYLIAVAEARRGARMSIATDHQALVSVFSPDEHSCPRAAKCIAVTAELIAFIARHGCATEHCRALKGWHWPHVVHCRRHTIAEVDRLTRSPHRALIVMSCSDHDAPRAAAEVPRLEPPVPSTLPITFSRDGLCLLDSLRAALAHYLTLPSVGRLSEMPLRSVAATASHFCSDAACTYLPVVNGDELVIVRTVGTWLLCECEGRFGWVARENQRELTPPCLTVVQHRSHRALRQDRLLPGVRLLSPPGSSGR